MIEYMLSSEGRAYVPVYVKPINDVKLTSVLFKIDTGAGDKSESAWHIAMQIFNFAGRDMKN